MNEKFENEVSVMREREGGEEIEKKYGCVIKGKIIIVKVKTTGLVGLVSNLYVTPKLM